MNDEIYPILSIIMPIYNVESYVEQCLVSIINQDNSNFELIIIDDGSKDKSLSICEKYARIDKRIYIYQKENGGLSSARNLGISKVRGKYIAFVDSDDYISSNMFKTLVDTAQQYDADIVVCGHMIVDGKIMEKVSAVNDIRVMTGLEATKEILLDERIFSFAWDKLYLASLWKGIEYPVGVYYEDTATTYKLFEKSHRVVQIPDCLYYYRRNYSGTCLNPSIKMVIKRSYDNFHAFYSRYLYVIRHECYSDIRTLCATKAFRMGIGALTTDIIFNNSTHRRYLRYKVMMIHIKDLSFFYKLRYYFIKHSFELYIILLKIKWKLV